jgi:hypothetical protein
VKADIFTQNHINVNINPKSWFFLTDLNAMEACIFLLAKMVIYEARLKETSPNITHLKNKLKQEVEIECAAARRTGRQTAFEKKWGPFKQIHRTQD